MLPDFENSGGTKCVAVAEDKVVVMSGVREDADTCGEISQHERGNLSIIHTTHASIWFEIRMNHHKHTLICIERLLLVLPLLELLFSRW